MGWFDKLKRNPPKNAEYAAALTGYTPIFSQFGEDIYASDVVQQAVNCIVLEMQKLNPRHVKKIGNDITTPKDSGLQSVLENPNELMTQSEFIGKIIQSLLANKNSFVIPSYYVWTDEKTKSERRQYQSLYPVSPTNVSFIQDASDTLFIELTFANNFKTTLLYSDVIHLRIEYGVNDFMGGGADGQADNSALLKTLNLNHQLLESISKAMKSSMSINGVVKIKTLMDKGKTEANLKELEEKLNNSESGFLPLDISGDFIPITRQIKLVDDTTLKFIDEKILRHFGVPLPILTGDYTKAQYEAFYQKTLEPLIVVLSQAFTKALFTSRERSFGNKILFFPKELIFMSTDQKLEAIRLLGDSGSLYENEKRVAFGWQPLPELEGVRMQSLNYANVDIAGTYQMKGSENNSNKEGNST